MADGSTRPIETRRQKCDKRLAGLKHERTSWEPHWRDLARFFLPRRGRFMVGDKPGGEKRHQDIINGRPLFAARTLSSGMMAGLTSPARPWFRLTTPDPALAEQGDVKYWLSDVEQRMRDVFSKSNLYQALPVFYHELGVFGTACMAALEDDKDVIRFQPFTIGSYWLAQNAAWSVDTFAREFKMTVRQVVEKFGIDACSIATRLAYEQGQLENWVDVCHLVEPNDERIHGRLDGVGMPWRSTYWERGGPAESDRMIVLSEKGFRENPILAARWTVTAEDIYGASPGMDALGDAKALQVQEKRKAMAIDKFVDPPMNAPGEMNTTRLSLLPGDVNYLPNPNMKFEPAYQTTPQIQPLLEDIAALEDRINTALYADLFLMLTLDARAQPPTAEEIRAREQEKLLMLGPVLERLNDELLDPMIDRVFQVMLRAGKIPPPPEALRGIELKVEYISVLAQAQKSAGLAGQDRLVGYVANLAAIKPDIMDKIDWDQSVDEYAQSLGVPPRIVVDDDQVAGIRQARADEAAQAKMAQMAQPAAQAATAASKLAETVPQPDSMLANIAGNLAGAVPA
ncbi:MAG TPA: portal protein [Vicinamibacterales bacterium]